MSARPSYDEKATNAIYWFESPENLFGYERRWRILHCRLSFRQYLSGEVLSPGLPREKQ
jgi:hypothetical protein